MKLCKRRWIYLFLNEARLNQPGNRKWEQNQLKKCNGMNWNKKVRDTDTDSKLIIKKNRKYE